MSPDDYEPDPAMPALKSELRGRVFRTRVRIADGVGRFIEAGVLVKADHWYRGLTISQPQGHTIRRVLLHSVELMKLKTP